MADNIERPCARADSFTEQIQQDVNAIRFKPSTAFSR